MTQEIMITETAAETEEPKTEKLCAESNLSEMKTTAEKREVTLGPERIVETSADTAMTVESELPELITESELATEVESEPITESTAVAALSVCTISARAAGWISQHPV